MSALHNRERIRYLSAEKEVHDDFEEGGPPSWQGFAQSEDTEAGSRFHRVGARAGEAQAKAFSAPQVISAAPGVPGDGLSDSEVGDCPQHASQILTKHGDRLLELLDRLPWLPNVRMGVSVEDERVTDRTVFLRRVRAAVRFLSCEPLFSHLDRIALTGIHWVIVGGESGPKARPM